jgi:hypothetical protein
MPINPVKSFPVRIVFIFLICISFYAETQEIPTGNYSVLVSPYSIVPGQIFRVLVTSEEPHTHATLKANGPSGSLAVLEQRKGEGPPYWWMVLPSLTVVNIYHKYLNSHILSSPQIENKNKNRRCSCRQEYLPERQSF